MTVLTIHKTCVAEIPLTVQGVSTGSFFTLKGDISPGEIYLKVNKNSNDSEHHRAVEMSSGCVRSMSRNMPVDIVFESATLDLVEKVSET